MSFQSWGYNCELPEGWRAKWGARCIWPQGYAYGVSGGVSGGVTPLDILHDRQSWYSPEGGEADQQALRTLLNRCGLLKVIQARMVAYVRQRHVTTSEANEVVLYENDFVKAVGNSNGSYGYFYLTVYIKPPPDLTKLIVENEPDRATEQGGKVWSNENLPRVGDRIRLNSRMGEGFRGEEVTVLAHAAEDSGPFLFLITTPVKGFAPNDYWVKQKAKEYDLLTGSIVPNERTHVESDIKLYNEPGYMLKRPGLDVLYIMGREWDPIEAQEKGEEAPHTSV